MDGRVQRDDAVAEHLARSRSAPRAGHRDALVGERRGGAAARESSNAEPVELPRERRETGLVVDGEERPSSCSDQLLHDLGQQAMLDRLDPRVQALGRVSRLDRRRAPAG